MLASFDDISPRQLVERLHHSLLNRIWGGVLLVSVLSFPASIILWMDVGFQTEIAFHMLCVLLGVVMVSCRKMLSLQFKSMALILSCFVVGWFGFAGFGLLGAEWFYVVLGITIGGMILPKRVMFFVWGVALSMILIFMQGYASGYFTLSHDIGLYHQQYEPWILLMMASVLLPAFVIQQQRMNQDALYTLYGEVKRQRDIIAKQMYFDELTELPARHLALDRLDMEIRRLNRSSQMSAVMFLDLDGFKAANDTYGHAAGDRVLCVVSRRMSDALREEDTIARYGGDEFLVILHNVADEKSALSVAQRLIKKIEEPVDFEGQQVLVSASIGVRVFDRTNYESKEILIIQADDAMYQAKNKGKGCAVAFAVPATIKTPSLLEACVHTPEFPEGRN